MEVCGVRECGCEGRLGWGCCGGGCVVLWCVRVECECWLWCVLGVVFCVPYAYDLVFQIASLSESQKYPTAVCDHCPSVRDFWLFNGFQQTSLFGLVFCRCCSCLCCIDFFFQAEDGIRDLSL
mgnify:CR=1 FL=1